jgi:hypothetical protein
MLIAVILTYADLKNHSYIIVMWSGKTASLKWLYIIPFPMVKRRLSVTGVGPMNGKAGPGLVMKAK